MKQLYKIVFLIFFPVLLFSFFSCSKKQAYSGYYSSGPEYSSQDDYSFSAKESAAFSADPPAFSAQRADFSGGSGANSTGYDDRGASRENPAAAINAMRSRKLIKNADLKLKVDDPALTEKPLAELMEKYNAWSASSGIYESSRYYSIRVPSAAYDAMLADLSELGKILRRSEYAEDVTLQYYDLESRLATKRELIKTYQGYLGRAKNIDEIMTVERRIAELQQEIDWTGTQFRNLADRIDYSTITVDISGPYTGALQYETTLKEKMSELFGSFGKVASNTVVVLTGIVIYGIPIILLIVLFFWLLFGRIGILKKLFKLAAGKKVKE